MVALEVLATNSILVILANKRKQISQAHYKNMPASMRSGDPFSYCDHSLHYGLTQYDKQMTVKNKVALATLHRNELVIKIIYESFFIFGIAWSIGSLLTDSILKYNEVLSGMAGRVKLSDGGFVYDYFLDVLKGFWSL